MKKRDKFMETLKKVPILAGLGDYELAQIADAATTNEHAADEVIIKQGDYGNTLMQYKEGDFFGELALLHDAPRAASIVTTSAGITLSLERKAFTRLLGSLSELRSQQYS